jgi:amino acid adenylation domain-containing protein
LTGTRRLSDWVCRQAASQPEAAAIVDRGRVLTYGALEEASNRIAWALHRGGCRPGDRVALLSPKSATAVAAMLAAYKLGALLVPLDLASPVQRLSLVLRSAGCGWLLAAGTAGAAGVAERLRELRSPAPDAGAIRLGWLGSRDDLDDLDDLDEAAGQGVEPVFVDADVARESPLPPPAGGAVELAHLLYTSGSTGQPKGVAVRHASVIHFVEWAVRHFRIERGERLSAHSPLSFDLSTFDLCGAFAAGATVHLVPSELNLLPHRLAELIRGEALTQWFSVPSLLTYMAHFDVVRHGDFPALRRLLWCGEVFAPAALAYWMQRLPHVAFTNLYGPTETTIASSYYDVPCCPDPAGGPVPIGSAIDGEELLVLGPALAPCTAGEVGELYIRGAGLSPGYWQDEARTREAFLPDATGGRIYRTGDLAWRGADGLIHLVGRTDSQIKSRGYRVELGEVEHAVLATGLVREAVVVSIDSPRFDGQAICCAYVPGDAGEASAPELRRAAGRALPAYMIPARWQAYEQLPRNGNGKLDRRLVRESFAAPPASRVAAAATG